jgi:metal-responsive CopG/Arc/MetJ family transcriptional regulator
MEQLTVRLSENLMRTVESEAQREYLTRSEYIRQIIQNRNKSERLRREYEEDLEELQQELVRLRNEKETIMRQREEILSL